MPKLETNRLATLLSDTLAAVTALPGKLRSLFQRKENTEVIDSTKVTPQHGANPEYKDPALEEKNNAQKFKLKTSVLKSEKYKNIQDSTAKLMGMGLGFAKGTTTEKSEKHKRREKPKAVSSGQTHKQ